MILYLQSVPIWRMNKMSSNTILLTDDNVYDIGGKTFTLQELREHAIDSERYQKVLKELSE